MTVIGPAATKRPPISRRRRLVFALLPLIGILLVAEIAIRLGRAPLHFGSFRELRLDLWKRNYPAERHPVLGYVPRAGFSSSDNHWGTVVSIDGDGMRRNGNQLPPAGDKVVAAVGDSFTFGDQVDDDATWPAQLETVLGKRVVNGGVFGYSLTQAVLRAEMMLEKYQVETLVVSFIPDDLTRCENSKRYTQLPWFDLVDGSGIELRNVPIPDSTEDDSDKQWKDLLGHSALLDVIFAHTSRAWWFENEKQIVVEHLRGRGKDIGKKLVERIDAACRTHGTRLLLVVQGDKPHPMTLEVLQHAKAAGVRSIDLASRFAELNLADPSLHARYFAGHMTREGNLWVAQQIAAELRSH